MSGCSIMATQTAHQSLRDLLKNCQTALDEFRTAYLVPLAQEDKKINPFYGLKDNNAVQCTMYCYIASGLSLFGHAWLERYSLFLTKV